MSNNNCVNNYIPEFVLQDLSWYEQDGLMTSYNPIKCQKFLRNSNSHFKTAKIINFNIIRREAAGEKVPDELLKKYQTVQNEWVSTHPKNHQKKILGSAFHTNRLDIFFEKDVVLNHFKK